MKYTPEQMLEAIKDSGGNVSLVAKRLRCGRSTVYRYAQRYRSVAEALEDEREDFLDEAESALHEAVLARDMRAIIFVLKTKGKDRGYTERVDVGAAVEREVRREMQDLRDALRYGLSAEDFAKVQRVLTRRYPWAA